LNRNESGRFGALKSDSTHHFFRNACTKSGSYYSENKLKFESIDISFVGKQIDKMNINKATGKDGISVNILKIAKPIVSKPITMLIKDVPDLQHNCLFQCLYLH
jgi:hypothetical protein